MAEEFHAGICEGTWWNNSSKTMPSGCSSPPFSTGNSDLGSFGWATTNTVDINLMSCDKESSIISVSDNSSIAFQGAHHQKPHQQPDSDSGTGSSILIDSTFKMMGFGLSSSTSSDWNQSFLTRSNGRSEGYNSILQEDISSRLSCLQEPAVDSSQMQKRWSPKSYTSPGEDSSIATFKPVNQDFSLETSTGNNTATCQGLSAEFPMGSASNYGLPSTLLQGLFEPDPQSQQQSLFTNRSINYMSTYGANVNELSNSWPPKLAPFIRPSLPKQHPSSLHFSNKTPFWNASATGINNVKAGFSPSPQPQFLAQTIEEKPNCPTITIKTNTKQVRNSASVMKKGSGEPPLKRTPSPLPTFKVRKEKLGDRITALQQLVSPFGKTDTASVLHEAIEYIKFLHDQVNVLSTPYMKQTVVPNSIQQQQQQSTDKLKQPEGPKQDLRSRGLCLVPISSTFPVANETTGDFWTPTFGGTFR